MEEKGLLNDQASLLVQKILEEKHKIEELGQTPRVVLIGHDLFRILERNWVGSVRDLPWGDALAHELEKRRGQRGQMFLGDGVLMGLWVVKVETLEGFKVY